MNNLRWCVLSVCVALAAGCGSDDGGAVQGKDAGSAVDSGVVDGGGDAGVPDAGLPDAGAPDAGPQTVTVHGKLLDLVGQPTGGLVALNERFDQAVAVGADGAFTFEKVVPPYDLSVFAGQQVSELRGLTRPDPTLVLSDLFGATQSTQLVGTVTHPAYPLPSSDHIRLSAPGAGPLLLDASASFNLPLIWHGLPQARTVDLVAVHYSVDAAGHVSFLESGGASGVTLQSGGTVSGLSLNIDQPILTKPSTVQVSFGGYTNGQTARLDAVTIGGVPIDLPADVQSGDTVSVPSEGGFFYLAGDDADGNQATLRQHAVLDGTTSLALPDSTQLKALTPGQASSGLPRAPTLRWTPVSGASLVYVMVVDPANGNALVYQAALSPDASTLTLTSFPDMGIGLAANHTYKWRVYAIASASSTVDAVADGSGLGIGQRLHVEDVTAYTTPPWSFTTAP